MLLIFSKIKYNLISKKNCALFPSILRLLLNQLSIFKIYNLDHQVKLYNNKKKVKVQTTSLKFGCL